MKGKGLIWVVVILVVLIVVVVFLQQRAKQKAMELQNKAKADEIALAVQFLEFKQNQDTINAQESASLGDWLSTIGSIGEGVAAVFGGISFGDGGGQEG